MGVCSHHSIRKLWGLIMIWSCISQMANDIEHPLICLFDIYIYILCGEVSVHILCSLLSCLFSYRWILIVFKIYLHISSSRNVTCKCFLPVCILSFHLLNGVFHRENYFNFSEVKFIIVGLRSWVPCWLLAGHLPQFRGHGPLHRTARDMTAGCLRGSKGEKSMVIW